ncbi:hypothetical protein [Rhizobium sp. BK251]|uniref:hypothetical protein n=1 Tax=Rhizobium sp. BK251 TaxID=2512125 RepID=UPI001042CBB6|nr:hypothetical protein [Rhizobium sp. BK251]
MSGGWNERLDKHFAELRANREGSGLPVFALEHGLSRKEFSELSGYLIGQLKNHARLAPDWLAWVVYGAELGYDFDGQEYWSSFEHRTPGWRYGADRAWLRDWYRKFHQQYQGFRPRGAWAEWFSIISWPITHAILPKDLQTQLARALFYLRFRVAARLGDEPVEIGRLIAFHSDGSSRFRNFLQQEELVGRIALALLGGPQVSPQGAIAEFTLSRIVQDLEKGQSAKAWLRDARKIFEEAQIKGVGKFGVPVTVAGTSGQARQSRIRLRPSLYFQRTEDKNWLLLAEFPSYRPLGELSPNIDRFLRSTRCQVSGAEGYLPAGWLISQGQRRVLGNWPDPARPLISFEKPNQTIEKLLQSDARLFSGSPWLFEIGPDGRAWEVQSKRVRPERHYLLVTDDDRIDVPFSKRAVYQSAGIALREINMPAKISTDDFKRLRGAGLQVARTISIWPAGLPPRRWDGEGSAEWYLGETPCIGISSDHEVGTMTVALDGSHVRTLKDLGAGQQIFLSMPDLAPGSHLLRVDAQVVDAEGHHISSTASIELQITAPAEWNIGTTNFLGIVPAIEPFQPSLDDFWEGRIALGLLGPAGYSAKIYIELLDAGNSDLGTELVTEASLPYRPDIWQRQSTQFIKRWTTPWAYLSASSGNLVVASDDLGTFRIPLLRDVRPVRLIWHSTQKATQVRLIDDDHGADIVSVAYYPFGSPCRALPITPEELKIGFEPPAPGGLFVLQHGAHIESVAVSMPQIASLSELAPDPDGDDFPSGKSALDETRKHLLRWGSAKIAGPLAELRRGHIVHRLEQHFFKLLCGSQWWEAERQFETSEKTYEDLKLFASKTGTSASFSVLLSREIRKLQALNEEDRADQFINMAARYGIADSVTCRAALAVGRRADGLLQLDEHALNALSNLGKQIRPILRAVRFMSCAQATDAIDDIERMAP